MFRAYGRQVYLDPSANSYGKGLSTKPSSEFGSEMKLPCDSEDTLGFTHSEISAATAEPEISPNPWISGSART